MELTAGYKQTDVGVMPEDWDLKPLRELLRFSNGVNADKHAYGRGTRFINVLEPISYSHIIGPEIPGRVALPRAAITSYAVKLGDIVFNRTSETDSELGLAAVYLGTEEVVFGGFVIRGRPTTNDLDPVYAGYALRAPTVRSQIIPMGQGAVRANIGQKSLGSVVAPVPPLSEQRAIAAMLSDVDALLSGLERLIAKKRDLKDAVTQQLLTGRTRLPGFSGEWGWRRLGQLVKVRHGKSQRGVGVRDGIYPILASGGEIGRTNTALYDGPSVLIGRKGTIDSPQYTDTPFWTVDTLFYTEISDEADARFLYYKFVTIPWRSYNEASGVPSLNARTIEGIEQYVPPTKREQTAIGEVLSDVDAEITALSARRDKTRDLKQAMMQELLTGSTRLALDEDVPA